MGGYVGVHETVVCISHVNIRGPSEASICLAYKTTHVFFGLSVYFHDDGYVLARDEPKPSSYWPLSASEIESYQASSLLPTPLPAYEVPWVEYAWGFAMWPLIAYAVFEKVRRGSKESRSPSSENLRPGSGP